MPEREENGMNDRYCLAVTRECSLGAEPHYEPVEVHDDLTVSAALHAWLTRGYHRTEDKRVVFHGGAHAVDLTVPQLLCDPDPAVQAMGEEWVAVVRWCVNNTRLQDVCSLQLMETA